MCKLMPPIFDDRLTSSESSSIVRSLTTKRTQKEIIVKREIGIDIMTYGSQAAIILFAVWHALVIGLGR